MTLNEYIRVFGSYWDRNEKKFKRFELWPKQLELCDFLEATRRSLVPKPRQGGVSEIFAEKALKEMMQYENTEGIVFSKSENFAQYFLEYRIKRKINNLPKHPGLEWPKIIKETKDAIELSNGSIVKSLSSSQTASASMSLDFGVFDEAGGIDENYGNFKQLFANALPSFEQNQKSWVGIVGTSVPGSYYNELVEEAYKDPDSEFKYFFLPWNCDPKRNEAWYESQKKLLKDDVYLQYPKTMDDFFFVKEGLVFKNFDAKEGGAHVKVFQPNWNMKFITGYDHGFIDPACALFTLYDQYSDTLYVFDEIYYHENHQSDVTKIANDYKIKLLDFPKQPSKQIADTQIFNRINSVVTTEKLFYRAGIRWSKSMKWDSAGSREALNQRFTHNKIVIHPRCVNLIDELRRWRWDVKSKKAEPEDKNNHAIDPLRYICAEIRKTDPAPEIEGKTTEYSSGNSRRNGFKPIGDLNLTSSNPYSWQSV